MPVTNAIESTFATVRHRTTRTRNCVSRPTFLGLAFKLIEEAEKTWRRINGPEKIKLLLEGVAFKDGEPVPRRSAGSAEIRRLKSTAVKLLIHHS
jgi:putative transposase